MQPKEFNVTTNELKKLLNDHFKQRFLYRKKLIDIKEKFQEIETEKKKE